jgi:hypothetical protein
LPHNLKNIKFEIVYAYEPRRWKTPGQY